MKAQIFTIDLVLGAVIILSILAGAYGLSAYYSSLSQASISSADLSAQISSAVTSFMAVTQTRGEIDTFQVNITPASRSTFETYTLDTLGKELEVPYSISIYALENYSDQIPTVQLLSYLSPGFQNSSGLEVFSEPIIVTNQTPLCTIATCNISLQAKSVFPDENSTVNAPDCNVYKNNGSVTHWNVFNDTPAGFCTIAVGNYTRALPNNYLVKTSEGNTTLYVLGLDLIQIKVQK